MRKFWLIAAALLALLIPAGAQAAGTASTPSVLPGNTSPFSPGVPAPAPATPTQTATAPPIITTTNTTSNGSFSAADGLIIAAGVVLVFGGIAFYVWWDSRKTAGGLRHAGPVGSGMASGVRSGSKPQHKPRKLSAQEKRRRKRGQAPRKRRR